MERQVTTINAYTMQYTDVDFRDEVKPSALLSYFLELACDNADALGFGYRDIMPKHFGFLVSNFYYELLRPVRLRETVSFETWPLPPGKALFFREFSARVDGELVARASSRWCLYHLLDGKILSSTALAQDYSDYRTDKSVESVIWRIPPVEPKGEPCFSVRIGIADHDHYRHVNNTKYADYILSCFSAEEWEAFCLTSFQITFLKQCRAGDKLLLYRERTGTEVLVSGYVDGEPVMMARLRCKEQS